MSEERVLQIQCKHCEEWFEIHIDRIPNYVVLVPKCKKCGWVINIFCKKWLNEESKSEKEK
jgi:predicted Zn finger-like uncharacterized protein